MKESKAVQLLVIEGPLAGQRLELGEGEHYIGRAPGSSLQLPDDPQVSWRHCRLLVRNGRCELEDLRSAFGTWVNGGKIRRVLLSDGDLLSLGDHELRFQQHGRESTAAESGDGAAALTNSAAVLKHASMLLFAFRAIPAASAAVQERFLQQINELIADLIPCRRAHTLVWAADAAPPEPPAFVPAPVFQEMLQFGSPLSTQGGAVLAAPVHAFGEVQGALCLALEAEAGPQAADHLDTLSAIASIASAALENARELEREREQAALLRESYAPETGIVGHGPAIEDLKRLIARVAPRDTTVLVLGESGTGKELVARAIHALSPRRDAPFVAINCAALSEQLLESELFGHEKGAFTGAVEQKKGKLELANGGTVFLDELGELAANLQAKLLRVLQQREFERVGGTRTLPLDVRLVAATNRDLAAEVKRGAFREDLYHRLNVVTLKAPPLRARREDILPLALHFLAEAAARCKRKVTGFSPEAERLLSGYEWPGNVRELQNAVERAVVLGSDDLILPEDLPETLAESAPPAADDGGLYQSRVVDAKRESILRAYEQGGDYKQAAKLLGIHPNYLLRLVRNLGLKDLVKERQG